MNSEQVNNIIQGIGVMTELWTITYQSFRKQGLNEIEAVRHTKELMSIMVDSFYGSGGRGEVK